MDMSWWAVLVAAVATLVGASIQGSIGFGMNLVTVPVLALVAEERLPATVVLLGFPLALLMTHYERRHVDWQGIVWLMTGRVPGTLIGAWIVVAVSAATLKGVIGVVVLLAVAASVFAPPIPMNRGTQVATGVVSGTTGTAAGIGGPPVALLYQHHDGPTMRSTLSASFLFGIMLSIAVLTIAGEVHGADFVLALVLTPVVVVGMLIGRRAHGLLDRGWMRPAVLTFAAVSALVVLADALR
jgi:uncharacterized membrane protein YfcA